MKSIKSEFVKYKMKSKKEMKKFITFIDLKYGNSIKPRR